jgi:hypothetical protein
VARSEDREATGIGILFDRLAIRQRLPYFVDQSEEVDRSRGVDLDHGPSACYRLESLPTPQFGGSRCSGTYPEGRLRVAYRASRVGRSQRQKTSTMGPGRRDTASRSWSWRHTASKTAPSPISDATASRTMTAARPTWREVSTSATGSADLRADLMVSFATMGQPTSSARPRAIVVLPLAGGPCRRASGSGRRAPASSTGRRPASRTGRPGGRRPRRGR